MENTLERILGKLDGYLMSISRNIETGKYELEVGFRKNWVFKSTEDINCDISIEGDSGLMVIISGKHDEVSVDDLVVYVNKVIETNQRITDMQAEFDKQLEDKKKEIENQILEFDEKIEKYKNSSLDCEIQEEKISKKKVNLLNDSNEFIDDDELAQKLS